MATKLNPANTLDGIRLGLSVSDSADLARLGLLPRHAELAVGEIARAVLIGGGSLVYGGRIKPSGFTKFLMHEVHRYGHSQSLTLCLAAPEHRKLSRRELYEFDSNVGNKGSITYLDEDGKIIEDFPSSKAESPDPITDNRMKMISYSSLRSFLGSVTDARVIIGGQLEGYQGKMPGIIEEAIISIQAGKPLYVVAGFGGAAALVAQALKIDDLSWAPDGFPTQPKDERIKTSINQLKSQISDDNWAVEDCGLNQIQLRQLSASHRPREIASLLIKGLSRLNDNTT